MQLAILLYTQNLMMQFLMNVQPMMSRLNQVIVCANESCILLLVVTLFALTDITVSNTSRSLIGNFVTYIVYGIVLGNFVGIVLRVITQLQFWFARIRFEIGMRRLKKEREEHNRLMSIMSRNKEKVKPDCEIEPINEEDDNNESSNLSAVRNDVRDYEKEIE